MTIAIWIIAIAEVIRLIQNAIQLVQISRAKEIDSHRFDRVSDAFIESLRSEVTE